MQTTLRARSLASRGVNRKIVRRPGAAPNVDFALCVMARSLGLPVDAAFALFAVGRCAGWIAHAVEQGQIGVFRLRARYVGLEPARAPVAG